MNTKDKYLIIGGVIVCLLIAIVSPFIASSEPDGLEKAAEGVGVGEMESTYESPLPDYSIEGLGKLGEIGALIIGVITTLIVALIITLIFKRRTPPEETKNQ